MLHHRLRAALQRPLPTVVGLVYAPTKSKDTTINLAAPAHLPGDILIASVTNRTTTPPALMSGYTKIVSGTVYDIYNNNRSLRVQYKVATGSSETVSWVGSYGHVWVVRNANTVIQSNLRYGTTATVMAIPSLSNLIPNSAIVAAGLYGGTLQSVTSPLSVLSATGGYVQQHGSASLSGLNLTYSGDLKADITYIVELY